MSHPVQIYIRQVSVDNGTVVAVTEDGTVWMMDLRALKKVWLQLPLPQ